ncbi:MAG: hypothetical protein ACJA1C_003096 [Crocinitomicaceae bacterium]|jgi:hypothetical protein
MKYAYLIFIAVLMASCGTENTDDLDVKLERNSEQSSTPKYSSKVYYLQDVGWCYQVFRGTKMILNQKHVPAVQGIKGFETKEKAEIAVNFIMERVIAGNERPSVTPEELDSIGAIDLVPEVLPINDIPSESNSPVELPPELIEKMRDNE